MYSYETLIVKDIESSSHLVSKKGNKYPASNMIDNKLETSWQDGKKGNGIGKSDVGSGTEITVDSGKGDGVNEFNVIKSETKQENFNYQEGTTKEQQDATFTHT